MNARILQALPAGARRVSPTHDAWLVEGGCLDVLSALPSSSVDLVFADPPYFLSNGGTTVQSGQRVSVDKGSWDVGEDAHVILRWHEQWLRAVQRVLRPTGTLWVSGTQHVIFTIGFALQRLGFQLLNTVTWFKPNASPNLACRMFTHSTELVLWAAPTREKGKLLHTFNYGSMKEENDGKQMRDLWQMPEAGGEQVVWSIPTPAKSEKQHGRHPTQKPLELVRRIIRASTAQTSLIVDPFMGSGTTGVAAAELNRPFIGIDMDPRYVELATRRIAAVL